MRVWKFINISKNIFRLPAKNVFEARAKKNTSPGTEAAGRARPATRCPTAAPAAVAQIQPVCARQDMRRGKRQRARAGRGPHDRNQRNGRGPDAGTAVSPSTVRTTQAGRRNLRPGGCAGHSAPNLRPGPAVAPKVQRQAEPAEPERFFYRCHENRSGAGKLGSTHPKREHPLLVGLGGRRVQPPPRNLPVLRGTRPVFTRRVTQCVYMYVCTRARFVALLKE
eukprot:gene23745-biopygen17848